MLVSLVVLSLIILIMVQITNSTATIVQDSRRMSSDTEARLIFNRMAVDFGRMLKRVDLDYSTFKEPAGTLSVPYGSVAVPANPQTGGNDQCAYYSETTGYFSGGSQPTGQEKAPVALIAYMIANDPITGTPVLRRMGKGLGWEPSGTSWQSVTYLPSTLSSQWSDLFAGDPDYKTVGSQTFRFEYNYLIKSSPTAAAKLSITPWNTTLGHTSINGFQDVAAIVVTIAVLDNVSRKIVSNYTALTSSLPDAQEGNAVAASWNSVVNSPTFAGTAQIPLQAATHVRIYERYFYLNSLEESAP